MCVWSFELGLMFSKECPDEDALPRRGGECSASAWSRSDRTMGVIILRVISPDAENRKVIVGIEDWRRSLSPAISYK